MNQITHLAHGHITPDHDLSIELIRPEDMPAIERTYHPSVVRIVWPLQATVISPREFSEIAAVTAVNGQVVIAVGGQLKVPTLRVFLSGC
jgi:hypothetical protein